MKLDPIENFIDFKFFMKIIGNKSFKHPKNKFQNQIEGSINVLKKK
jgi:hypothetical protein